MQKIYLILYEPTILFGLGFHQLEAFHSTQESQNYWGPQRYRRRPFKSDHVEERAVNSWGKVAVSGIQQLSFGLPAENVLNEDIVADQPMPKKKKVANPRKKGPTGNFRKNI